MEFEIVWGRASLLFIGTMVFSWLAYDARRWSVSSVDVPYSVTAKWLGHRVDGVSLHEQAQIKRWNLNHGFGNLNKIIYLWVLLALTCAMGVIAEVLASVKA